jgi:hypothetical protein
MASLAQMEQELIVERTRAVAGSSDRTLRVWVAERRGDYHLHRRGSYLQLCLRSGRANEYCRRRARPSAFPATRRSRHKNTASNRQYKDRAPHRPQLFIPDSGGLCLRHTGFFVDFRLALTNPALAWPKVQSIRFRVVRENEPAVITSV